MSSPPRVAYVIPAYNEERAIGGVVRGLQADAPPGDIFVIDDASRDDTAGAARAAGAIVLRHIINRGQGAALQTGFDAALRRSAEVIITFDADGQHTPADAAALVAALVEHDADVVLGSRFLGRKAENMPAARRWLLRGALWFTRVVSRVHVTDTHNGLRAFRASALERIRISEDRMAHASELLDLIGECDLRHVEIPCHVRYTEYSMRKGQRWHAALPIAFNFLVGKVMR
ncbi:MAG: glycosyltransferase family 2 protein [Phycisphaerales bacterium]|nr:glycosyltransferase family 2 protein [Phycisphaerales bacterium]